MNRKLDLAKKGLLIIALPFSIQLLLTLAYGGLTDRAQRLAEFEYRSKAVIGGVNWIMLLVSVATNSAYAFKLTNDKNYREVGETCLKQVNNQEINLKSLMAEKDFVFPEFFRSVSSVSKRLEESFKLQVNNPDKNDQLLSTAMKSDWVKLFDTRKELLASERNSLRVESMDLPWTRQALKGFLFVAVIADIAFAIILVRLYNLGIAKRLAVLTDDTLRLAKGIALNPLEPGEDEISELARFFHKMAEELTASRNELEQGEQRLKSLIENMPIGFITLDDQGSVQAANARVIEMFGLRSEDILGKDVRSLASDLAIEELFARSGKSRNGTAPILTELETTTPDGSPLFLELTLNENHFRDETLKLLALQDITQRRMMEQVRAEFLNMVSHDIKSPLMAIQLTNELLLDGSFGLLPEKAQAKIATSQKNSNRLLEMINNLLDFEKLRAGRFELAYSEFDSNSLITKSFESVQNLADAKDLRLEGPIFSLFILGDEDRLLQVLINLLSNAIKFSSPGSVVRVSVLEKDSSIEFQVIDCGRGVPLEFQEMIFEKYKQVDREDSTRKKGTGLGLPICKLIVEQHKGSIGVRSTPGKGSTFWFRLPKRDSLAMPTELDTNI